MSTNHSLYIPPAIAPAAHELVPLPPGTVIDQRIHLTRLIRKDRHGFLYEAIEPAQHEPTVLRALTELAGEPEQIFGVLKELVAKHERLSGQNICRYVEAGQESAVGGYWLRAEWAEGQLLERWLQDRPGLPLPAAISLLGQIAAALTEANEHELFHSDLRPSNILICQSQDSPHGATAKLIDLGLETLYPRDKRARSSLQGAPLWLAPEQTGQGRSIGYAVDVWSFGLLTFKLLTGRSYWRSASLRPFKPLQALRELMVDALEPASVRASALGAKVVLPLGFDEWFSHCLARDPSARFHCVEAAFHALPRNTARPQLAAGREAVPAPNGRGQSVLQAESGTAAPLKTARPAVIARATPLRRLAAMGALLLLLGAGGLRWKTGGSTRAPAPEPAKVAALPTANKGSGARDATPPTPLATPLPPELQVPPSLERPTARAMQGAPTRGQSASCGSPEQCFRMAQSVLSTEPQRLVALWLSSACTRHHGEACRALGEIYENGVGATKNPLRAQSLYRRGCQSGSSPACSRYQSLLHERCLRVQATACTELGQFLREHPSSMPSLYAPERYLQLGCANGDPRACLQPHPSFQNFVPPPHVEPYRDEERPIRRI